MAKDLHQKIEGLLQAGRVEAVIDPMDGFLATMRRIDGLMREASMEAGYQRISWAENIAYFKDVLEPARKDYEALWQKLLENAGIDFDASRENEAGPVWNVLRTGLDFWQLDEAGQFSADDLKDTEDVMSSSWFRPDTWLIGFNEIKPVIGKGLDKSLPNHVRHRLSEIYRSYAFGHYFSAIALSRAVLEYTVKDRASSFDLALTWQDGKKRKLGHLVEDMGERLPELREHMQTITEAGNETLHPAANRADRIALDEPRLRATAKNVVVAIKAVLERLYRR